MEITIQETANNILNSINPGILSSITSAMSDQSPEISTQKVYIERPSFLVSIGKNAEVQAKFVMERFGDLIKGHRIHQIEGYSISSLQTDSINSKLQHPLPTSETFEYTRETLKILMNLGDEIEDVHILISGGGSAAFSIPEDGIDGGKYVEIVRLAMIAGFSIEELNLIRSLIDKVKGGKLLQHIPNKNFYSWISSDVVSDDPKVIASGPINPGIEIDRSIIKWLERLFLSLEITMPLETLKSKLSEIESDKGNSEIISNRMELISSLQGYLEKLSFQVVLADVSLNGSVELVANQMEQLIDQFNKFSNRILIYSGEPTISLTTPALESGEGGRISALSCLIAKILHDKDNYTNVSFIGVATDGRDGSSQLSGYVVDNKTQGRLEELGTVNELIQKGNSGLAMKAIDSGFILKRTNLNLMDIYLIIIK